MSNLNNYKKVLRHTTLFSNTEFIDEFIEYVTINSYSATTLAKGIGNIFEPTCVDLSGYHIVLVKPNVHISTAEAYGGCKPQRWTTPLEEAIKQPITEWKDCIFNDFEKTVFIAHPELAEIKAMLYKKGAIYAAMSGSGSTIYGIFDEKISDITTSIQSQIYHLQLK